MKSTRVDAIFMTLAVAAAVLLATFTGRIIIDLTCTLLGN